MVCARSFTGHTTHGRRCRKWRHCLDTDGDGIGVVYDNSWTVAVLRRLGRSKQRPQHFDALFFDHLPDDDSLGLGGV